MWAMHGQPYYQKGAGKGARDNMGKGGKGWGFKGWPAQWEAEASPTTTQLQRQMEKLKSDNMQLTGKVKLMEKAAKEPSKRPVEPDQVVIDLESGAWTCTKCNLEHENGAKQVCRHPKCKHPRVSPPVPEPGVPAAALVQKPIFMGPISGQEAQSVFLRIGNKNLLSNNIGQEVLGPAGPSPATELPVPGDDAPMDAATPPAEANAADHGAPDFGGQPQATNAAIAAARKHAERVLAALVKEKATASMIKHAQAELDALPTPANPHQDLKDLGFLTVCLSKQLQWNAAADGRELTKITNTALALKAAQEAHDSTLKTNAVGQALRKKAELELRASIATAEATTRLAAAQNGNPFIGPVAQMTVGSKFLAAVGGQQDPLQGAQAQEMLAWFQNHAMPEDMLRALTRFVDPGMEAAVTAATEAEITGGAAATAAAVAAAVEEHQAATGESACKASLGMRWDETQGCLLPFAVLA